MARSFHAIATLLSATVLFGCGEGNGGASGAVSLQNPCVSDQLNLERTLADGSECRNFGFSDCSVGSASECVNFCANNFCQPESCASPEDCLGFFGELPSGFWTWLGFSSATLRTSIPSRP